MSAYVGMQRSARLTLRVPGARRRLMRHQAYPTLLPATLRSL